MILTRLLPILVLFLLQCSGVFAALAAFTMQPVRIGDPLPTAKEMKKGVPKPPALYGWTGHAVHTGGTITPAILIEYGVAALAKCQATIGQNSGVWKVGTMVAYTPDRINVWFGSSVKAEKAANMFDDTFRTQVPIHPAIDAALDACTAAYGGQHNNLGHCAEIMAMNNFANLNPGAVTPGANPLIVAIRGSDSTVFSPCGTPIPDPANPGQTVGFDLHDGNTWGCSQFLANLGFTRLHQICGLPGDPTAKRRRSLPVQRRQAILKKMQRRDPTTDKKAKAAKAAAGTAPKAAAGTAPKAAAGTAEKTTAKTTKKTGAGSGATGGLCMLIPKPVAAEAARIMALLKKGVKAAVGKTDKQAAGAAVAGADKKKAGAAAAAPPPAANAGKKKAGAAAVVPPPAAAAPPPAAGGKKKTGSG